MRLFRNDIEARFIKRPNRFIIYAKIDTKEVKCHCPNTGRMGELLLPDVKLILEQSINPNRKTKYSVVAVYKGELIVPITSVRANRVAKEVIIPKLFDSPEIKSEVLFGKSRFDFLVKDKGYETFIEVKSCTLFEGDRAIFPDAPTLRGTKHLNELMIAKDKGYRGMVILVVFNPESRIFSPNSITDPLFSSTLESVSGEIDIVPYKVGISNRGKIIECRDSILPIKY